MPSSRLRVCARGVVATVAFAAAAMALAREARALCGLYVGGTDARLLSRASQVVVMREGARTVVSLRSHYEGPLQDFALVVPVPGVIHKDAVRTLSRDVFEHIDRLDAPRLVETWEDDPCARPAGSLGAAAPTAAAQQAGPAPPARDVSSAAVTIEAQFVVGEYDIAVVGAREAAGLEAWLRQEHYKLPSGAEALLRPYVQAGSKFLVARVDAAKVPRERGRAMLSPLRFHYDADARSDLITLPLRLGLLNAEGPQDVVVHVLGEGHRYEAATLPNATIPTNLDVTDAAKADFSGFYAALFDRALERNPRAVVTEYAWDANACDACPAPPLTEAELVTLGADVLPSVSSEPDLVDAQLLRALGAEPPGPKSEPARGAVGELPGAPARSAPAPSRRRYYGLRPFVLTRLHLRYASDAVAEDLVLREAPPIAGGREHRAASGELERGASPASVNAFQARYVVRHAWTGPIACAEPTRGSWREAAGGLGNGPPRPAVDAAFAERKNVQLASILRSDVTELGLAARGAPPVAPASSTASVPPPRAPESTAARRGCSGCTSGAAGAGGGLWALLAGSSLWLVRARRRRAAARACRAQTVTGGRG